MRSHLAIVREAAIPTPMSNALLPKNLAHGYTNFRANRYAQEQERYLNLAGNQKPKAMVIACCDSRSGPETIFDAGPGELFVVRNVANLVPPYAPDGKHHSTSAALEFGVMALGVEHLVVMGHGGCGGIKAAAQPDFNPLSTGDFIGKWMSDIKDIVRDLNLPPECTDEQHMHIERVSIEHSLANLRTFPWVRTREQAKQLTVHGAWFDVGPGELHVFDEVSHVWVKA